MKPSLANLVDSLAESSDSKRALERRLVEMGTGILSALRAGKISYDEARRDLFNMDNLLALRRHKASQSLREFFQWAMELEDVNRLAPEGLPESYERLAQLSERILASSTDKPIKMPPRPAAGRGEPRGRDRKVG
jgi:hypothetical protein